MTTKKNSVLLVVILFLLLGQSMSLGANPEDIEIEKQEFKQELARIKTYSDTLKPKRKLESFENPKDFMKYALSARENNDIGKYEEFADEIQNKWKLKNKEYYARITLELCKLSTKNFKGPQRYELARKYALTALEERNEIPLVTELELTGRVMTTMIGPDALKGEKFAQRRKKDTEIRLLAWKRLIDAVDPNWNPDEQLVSPKVVAISFGLPGTIEPEAIQDPALRAEYEAALEKNQQKIERYSEQNELRKWLKRYKKTAGEYIILAYSTEPYNNEELIQYFNDYKLDEKIKNWIIQKVQTNIQKK